MKSSLFLSALLLFNLSACVEIKDPNETKDAETPKVEVTTFLNNLFVEKEVYLWQGKVLTTDEYKKTDTSNLSSVKPIYKFDNVEIAQGAVIYTLGQTLKIEIKNLNSKGRIETFPEGATAAAGVHGRSGGHLEIYINNPLGELDFVFRGENGGNGIDGKKPDESKRGTPGIAANCAGRPADIEAARGGRGAEGFPGQNGGNGGHSGSANIYVSTTKDIIITMNTKIPGESGRGGRGGEGGERGRSATVCGLPPVLSLIPKLPGPPGPNGNDGVRGSTQPSCIYQDRQPACG